jgi:hypothetical protein
MTFTFEQLYDTILKGYNSQHIPLTNQLQKQAVQMIPSVINADFKKYPTLESLIHSLLMRFVEAFLEADEVEEFNVWLNYFLEAGDDSHLPLSYRGQTSSIDEEQLESLINCYVPFGLKDDLNYIKIGSVVSSLILGNQGSRDLYYDIAKVCELSKLPIFIVRAQTVLAFFDQFSNHVEEYEIDQCACLMDDDIPEDEKCCQIAGRVRILNKEEIYININKWVKDYMEVADLGFKLYINQITKK